MTLRIRKILAALTAFCLLALSAPLTGAVADSHYYITVDLTNQIVTVYDSEKTDDTNIVRQMICSSGRNATPTPMGTYHLPSRGSSERSEWYYFPKFKCYAKWATRITGGILFHSTLFTSAKKGPTSSSTRALGSKASHGCVRLRVNDAKFIAQNCGTGTKCRIYASGKTNAKLRSKLKRKSFIRDKQTYDSFMGRKPKESPLPLGRGSTGSLVTQMQTRLKALGYYGGAVNGVMGKSTVAAVKAFQGACGVKKTGRVNQVLWNVMFADSAPVGAEITLAEGSSGPAVAALQTNLITLLMMQGDADGSFTATTAEGVRNYQNTFGYAVTGTADGNLQTDIAERAAQVRQSFGSTPYALSVVTTDARMARVKAHSGVRLRQTASKKGKTVKKLKYKSSMRVLSDGKLWTKVRANGRTGYVKRTALTFYNENVTENGYVEVSLPAETTAEATASTAQEVSIPTQADSAPAETDGIATEADGIVAEASDAAMAASADDNEAIADAEPQEEPDNGLEMEAEALPEQTEEIAVEASEEIIDEAPEALPDDVPDAAYDEAAPEDDIPEAGDPAAEGDMLMTSEE